MATEEIEIVTAHSKETPFAAMFYMDESIN
jgi:hypothetical protein